MFVGTTAQGPADEKTVEAAQAAADAAESTQATDSTEAAAKPEAEASADTPADDADEAPEEGWKAHARQWERRAKADRKQVESLMAAISDKDATIEGLRTEVAERQRAAERAEKIAAAASEYGVPADLIRGDTDEEITDYAKRLSEWRGEAAPVVPKLSDSGAGAFPARPANLSIDDQILAAQKAGDFKESSRLKAIKLSQLGRS